LLFSAGSSSNFVPAATHLATQIRCTKTTEKQTNKNKTNKQKQNKQNKTKKIA